jgi:hypothetical protein
MIIGAFVLLLPLMAGADPAPVPYNAVEGPFASVEQYCKRLDLIKPSCTIESVQPALPTDIAAIRAIRVVRVRTTAGWHWNRLVLAVETAKGLYIDERFDTSYDDRSSNDSTVTSIKARVLPKGRGVLRVELHGTTGAPPFTTQPLSGGGYDAFISCWIGDDGSVACSDPAFAPVDQGP